MNKKTTFLLSAFVVSMLMPLALTSCGEDIQVPDNPNNEEIENPLNGAVTEFTGSKSALDDADGTRTSMDKDRHFYWEPGDVIWLDEAKDGQFSTKLRECKLSNPTKAPQASFYLRGKTLTEPKYDILYTGNDTTTQSPFSVTIAKEQKQKDWNDASHLGESGDCGVAEAIPNGSGKYSFVVKHKAAYLVLYPYINNTYSRTYSLTKVEITSDNTIAGTYQFSVNGIHTDNVTDASNKITLTMSTPLAMDKAEGKHLFVVIQPGTHSLSIAYTYQNESGEQFTTTNTLPANRKYKVNGVTSLKEQKLTPFAFFFENAYYQWDALNWYWKGVDNYPTANDVSATGYATSTSDANNRYYHYGTGSCNQSAKSMPSYAAMTWYLQGGAYWDNTTEWTLTDNKGNTQTITCGVWIKKWEYLPSGKSTTTPIGNTAGNWSVRIAATLGKPAASVINQYFFLPALGQIGNGSFRLLGTGGYYWSRTLHGTWASEISAHDFYFLSGYVYATATNGLSSGFVANTRPDGTNWFQ